MTKNSRRPHDLTLEQIKTIRANLDESDVSLNYLARSSNQRNKLRDELRLNLGKCQAQAETGSPFWPATGPILTITGFFITWSLKDGDFLSAGFFLLVIVGWFTFLRPIYNTAREAAELVHLLKARIDLLDDIDKRCKNTASPWKS